MRLRSLFWTTTVSRWLFCWILSIPLVLIVLAFQGQADEFDWIDEMSDEEVERVVAFYVGPIAVNPAGAPAATVGRPLPPPKMVMPPPPEDSPIEDDRNWMEKMFLEWLLDGFAPWIPGFEYD